MTRCTVAFRGGFHDVTARVRNTGNGTCEVEWLFDGLTVDENNDLHVTAEEEESIIDQIIRAWNGGENID